MRSTISAAVSVIADPITSRTPRLPTDGPDIDQIELEAGEMHERDGPERAAQHRHHGEGGGVDAPWVSFRDILFDFDKWDVRGDETSKITDIVVFMKNNPTFEIGIEGYTDPRGTNVYNQALSNRRVIAIRDALVAGGARIGSIRTGAQGEENRNCREDTESCYQRNRRVEVFVRPDAHTAAR